MGAVSVGVHPDRIGRVDGLRDLVGEADAAEREVAGGYAFRELDHVRLDSPVLEAELRARSTEAGDDLVGNQQHLVLVQISRMRGK